MNETRTVTRRVLMLGGPEDGRELSTTCWTIDTLGVWTKGGWRAPSVEDRQFSHVLYRVRPGAEVTHPYEWARRATGWEWVATFEGVVGHHTLPDYVGRHRAAATR